MISLSRFFHTPASPEDPPWARACKRKMTFGAIARLRPFSHTVGLWRRRKRDISANVTACYQAYPQFSASPVINMNYVVCFVYEGYTDNP